MDPINQPQDSTTPPQAPTVNSQDFTSPAQNPYAQPTAPIGTGPKKKHGPLLVVVSIIIVLVLVIVGVGVAAYIIQSQHPVKKMSVRQPEQTQTSSTVLQTFTKNTDKSLIVMQGDKQIATQVLPTGKATFTLIGATNNMALVLAYTNGNDPAPAGYTITSKGTITSLTPSIALTVSKTSGYLDEDGNYLSVACQNTSCVLNSLNLITGVVTPITSQSYTAPAGVAADTTSMALLGISQKNIVYLITFSQNSAADPVGTLTSVDLSSKSVTKSMIMQKAALNLPDFSPDFAYALYTQAQDSATGQLVDWSKATTTQVNGTIGNGPSYIWSPDSSKALFLNSPFNQTSTLGIIKPDASQTVLKTFPTSATVGLQVYGWLDNSTIEYALSTTTTPNNFLNSTSLVHTYNVATGADTTDQSGKTLLPVSGTSLDSI